MIAEFADQTGISHTANSTSYTHTATVQRSRVCRHKGLDLERRSPVKPPVSEYGTHNNQLS